MIDRRRRERGMRLQCASVALETLEARRLLAAELVKDIDDTGGDALVGSAPMVEYNGELYFFPIDLEHGRELWRTDGTPEGTSMVKDGVNGRGGLHVSGVELAGGLMFYVDKLHGHLWRSDGTAEGTFVLADATDMSGLVALGDELLFVNADRNALWKTDGTANGTVLVRSLDDEPAPSTYVIDLTVIDGIAYFGVFADSMNRLWQTDGTPAGTFPVEQAPEWQSSVSSLTAADGGRLYFFLSDDEPWLFEIATGQLHRLESNTGRPQDLATLGGTLFFTAGVPAGVDGRELWRSVIDGQGMPRVEKVKDIVPGPDSSEPDHLTVFNGALYFTAHDGKGTYGLWRSDGTEAGTVLVLPLTQSAGQTVPTALSVAGDRLYVALGNNVLGDSIWSTDGSAAGTTVLAQLTPDGIAFGFAAVEAGGRTFFPANDGVSGLEVWSTDDTASGTGLVKDIHLGTASSSPSWPFVANGLAYYFASHGAYGGGLWRTDGTANGTVLLAPPRSARFIGSNGSIGFFAGNDGENGSALWRTDGTPEGTWLLNKIIPDLQLSNMSTFATLNGTAYFTAAGWTELWLSDGTVAGTVKVMDLPTGVLSMVSYEGALYFTGDGKLWRSDGTAPGTAGIPMAMPGVSLKADPTVVATNAGVFVTVEETSLTAVRRRVWITDGTAAGTRPVGDDYTDPMIISAGSEQAFFMASDPVHGRELWRTDGTDAGTRMIADLRPGPEGQRLSRRDVTSWHMLGERLLAHLVGPAGQSGVWSTDGTPAGTQVLPLSNSAVLGRTHLANADDVAIYMDHRGAWGTDGTAAGTIPIDWLPTSHELSWPRWLIGLDGDVLFTAFDPTIGTELWKLEFTVPRVITGTEGDDRWTVRNVGDDGIGVWVGDRSAEEPPDFEFAVDDIASLMLIGGGGDDALVVELRQGAFAPAGGIVFDGGDGTDAVTVTGDGILTGSYVPDGRTFGSGTIAAGGARVSFAGVEPIMVGGLTTLTVTTPNSHDSLTINTPVAGRSRIAGTSDEVPITPLMFFDVARLVLDVGANDVPDHMFAASPGGVSPIPPSQADDGITIGDGGIGASGFVSLNVQPGLGYMHILATDGIASLEPIPSTRSLLDVENDAVVNLVPGTHFLWELFLRDEARVVLESGGETVLEPLFFGMWDGGTLDLRDNSVRLTFEPAQIEPRLASARNATPRWSGPGIGTSFATELTGLGSVVQGSRLVVKYTYNGDANLDGRVDADDYFRIDSGFISHPADPTYAQGDFNFDDRIDADDYFLIDSAFLGQRAMLGAAPSASTASIFATARSSRDVADDDVLPRSVRRASARVRR